MIKSHRFRLALFASVAAFISAGQATAQTAQSAPQSSSVEEIVVTANRVEQNLSKVALSVAAFSQQRMDLQGIKQIDDIVRLTPGISLTRGSSPFGGQITIRGIVSSVGAGTTGIYINDTPIQVRTLGATGSSTTFPIIFDLERVEILRGPQGTLFGAGSEGGAVRFITPTPSLTTRSAYSRAEYAMTEGGSPSYEIGAAVGGPIVQDKLGFRVSAFYRRDGGYIDRVPYPGATRTAKNINDVDVQAYRAALKWEPVENLTISPSIFFQIGKAATTNTIWDAQSEFSDHRFINGGRYNEPFKDKFVLPSLNVNYDFGPVQFASTTAYFYRNAVGYNDYTGTNLATYSGNAYPAPNLAYFYSQAEQGNEQMNYSQEFRFSSQGNEKLNWVVGAFFEQNEQSSLQKVVAPFFPRMYNETRVGRTFIQNFGRDLLPGGVYILTYFNTVDKQKALFGQVDYNITPELKLTAGVRVSKSTLAFNAFYDGPSNGATSRVETGAQSAKPITPKVGLSYQYDPNNLFYANYAKGFRIGGAQAALATTCTPEVQSLGYASSPVTFDPDSVKSYEIGSKNKLADGRITIDASLFKIDWKDIQRSIAVASCARSFTANLGSARSFGFDVSADLRVTDDFNLGVQVGRNDASLTQTVLGGLNAAGVRPVLAGDKDSLGVAPWTVTLTGQYNFQVAETPAYARADWTYSSNYERGTLQNAVTSSYDPTIAPRENMSVLNLRAGTRMRGADISLFVKNALDTSPVVSRGRAGRTTSTLYTLTTIQPRTFGIQAAYRY